MFIIFGTRQTVKKIGDVGVYRCDHCNNVIVFQVMIIRKWFTLFWIPIFPYSIQYYIICPICQYGGELTKENALELVG